MIADVVCGEEAIYVGSDGGCRVHLADTRIGPQQAVVFPERRGNWSLQQLHPECQVLVNNSAVGERIGLQTGDEIRITEYAIRVFPEFEGPVATRPEPTQTRAQLERFAASRLPSGTLIKKPEEPLLLQGNQLYRFAESNLAVSQCLQVEALMDIALKTFLSTFAGQRAWIGIRRAAYGPMEYVEGRLLTGGSTDLPEAADVLKPRVLDRGQFLLVPILSDTERSSVLAGPLLGPDGNLGMFYLDTGATGRRYETTDLDAFIALLSVFSYQLDAIFKQIARTRAAMVAGEVAVAHAIQARLTPRKLPQWPQLQWGAFREPGRETTGDMYDVVKLSSGAAAFMVAHTPARGPMPSMLMAEAQAAFRFAAMHQDAPHLLLRSLSWLLYDGQDDHPLNCIAGTINPDTGEVKYSIAGRCGAYIISSRGEERSLCPQNPTPALGLQRNAAYPLLPEQLDADETVVVFSPGITTAKNREEETFGEERFVNILCDGFGQLASAMMKDMLTDLRNFTEGGAQPDDITVLMAHRVGG